LIFFFAIRELFFLDSLSYRRNDRKNAILRLSVQPLIILKKAKN